MPMTTPMIDELIYLEQRGWYPCGIVTDHVWYRDISIYRHPEMPNLEVRAYTRDHRVPDKNYLVLGSVGTRRCLNYLTGKKLHHAAEGRKVGY